MDQKRLPLFIAISLAILLVFQWLTPRPPVPHPVAPAARSAAQAVHPAAQGAAAGSVPSGVATNSVKPPANVPRVAIEAPRVAGSISLLGARIDDLRLRDYHETVKKTSPLVRLLAPADDAQPAAIQFGWSSLDAGVKVPDDSSVWKATGGPLGPGHEVTLSWDNGAGLTFEIALAVDDNYMFDARQRVHASGTATAQVWPWQRVRRDYEPKTAGYSILFEGPIGVMDKRLHTEGYSAIKKAADAAAGVGYTHNDTGGWAGFTDIYWLTALIPDQAAPVTASWNHWADDGTDHYQVSYAATTPEHVSAGHDARFESRIFAGAKEVHLLDHYETAGNVPLLSYAVDWGRLFFLTKPFFYAIDWIYSVVGNFGVAIMIFTLGVKGLFYPIAARSYVQMGKMRLLQPKLTEVRERYKDDPQRMQAEMMAVYKGEKVNPVSGCLPMLLQIPVFFSLYKVILSTIEMRHAPFFGWIQDLSATDPTNLFNLFGLIPFDPSALSPLLHLGVWPMVMGATMYFQQKLSPPPPDPAQARMLQFMPLIFVFTMGRFPAGLVIYWSWNNALTMAQQWWIQRNAKLTGPASGPKPARPKVARS